MLKIFYNSNFILSGLNLAFLGYYFKGDIKYNNKIIHWPDGLFAKTIFDRIDKIPGRNLINNMNLPNNIRKIIVLGNLSNFNKDFLKKKFHLEVEHIPLPYGNFEKIKKVLTYHLKNIQ